METKNFEERLREYSGAFAPVVPFDKSDKLLLMDFTEKNRDLTAEILNDTDLFIRYINLKLGSANAKYGIGGYNEHRTIYSRSKLFGPDLPPTAYEGGGLAKAQNQRGEDPGNNGSAGTGYGSSPSIGRGGGEAGAARRLHLGIDTWGKPYTKVMTPLNGIVHSFAFNNAFGDYGATIILTHNLDGTTFHTLYGHLSLNSIKNIQEGDLVKKGDVIAEFGIPFENGHWPPHLHFQIIIDIEGMKGDYPGVCAFSEREKYLKNCPDPDLILQMMQYAG